MTHLFFNIGLFPFIMVLSVLVFFDADWPRKLLARLPRPPRSSAPAALPAAPTARWKPLTAVFTAAVLAFCTVQFLMPLRHWLYPGTVLWHEQGMRFSWRVMLREKSGSLTYEVVTADGETRQVSPHAYLTEAQYREMVGQPDLILQLAHRIRDDFNARGKGPVAVYADTKVSLNGRRARPLINPDADLALVQDGLGRADWITEPPEADPPLQRPLQLATGL